MIMLLALVSPALADHWWGIGPTLGTTGFPLEYPAVMPALAQNSAGKNLVEPAGFDARIGGHGVYYIGNGNRIGLRAFYDGNFSTFSEGEVTVEYDWILTKDDNFQVFGGAGLGFGSDRFLNEADTRHLDVTYFPLRAQLGVLWRDRTRAYEADLFGTWHIAGDQSFFDCGSGGNCEAEHGTAVADPFGSDSTKSDAALYAAVGAEVTVYFGNFRNKGGNKGDNDNDGKKGGGKKKKKQD